MIPKSRPVRANAARMQACSCVWKGDSATSSRFLLVLPFGQPGIAFLGLAAFGADAWTSPRTSCPVIKG
ncbi:MAG: hypothetical protein NTV43_00275 [Methylococcales bacterium]|nr:hypothetical protein [Methylococcales bacterium]